MADWIQEDVPYALACLRLVAWMQELLKHGADALRADLRLLPDTQLSFVVENRFPKEAYSQEFEGGAFLLIETPYPEILGSGVNALGIVCTSQDSYDRARSLFQARWYSPRENLILCRPQLWDCRIKKDND